jgi:Tol biopolymer transport system component
MTVGCVLCGARPVGAQLFDPELRFRQLTTEHFVLYFHQGEEGLAQRLAPIAEETWRTLRQPLGVTPPARTRVVLADQTELFNGYATPVPYDTVVLYAVTPSGSDADFDDWLRLIFTHEFTHIVHLDRSESWARVLRGILGRAPYAFPNIFLPQWQIEGLAVFEESSITGRGRLHAGDFLAIVNEGARDRRLEPLDRVNGGLTDWPSGAVVYAYGAGFHQYLADRFGAQTLATLAEATARRVPYVASPVFKRIFGESLGELWRDYEASLAAKQIDVQRRDPPITRLTWQGFSMNGPRFDRYVCAGCPPEIVYSAANPHGFPALYRVGLEAGTPRRLTTRYLGSTAGLGREHIYFDQLELNRNAGLYGDLYAYSRADGGVRRLTSDARLVDPDLSPDGQRLVCVRNRPGQRDLVLISLGTNAALRTDLASPTVLLAEAGTQFDAPRWSPDGRTVVVERHRLGADPEIVLVDVETKAVRVLAAAPRTRFATPTWRPDGVSIVAAAAQGDETFNLFEFPLDGSRPRQLTHTSGGALWPDVSPDGHTIVFVGYTADGDDLFAMPYPSAQAGDAAAFAPSAAPEERNTEAQASGIDVAEAREYSPLDTLKPTSWTPLIDTSNDQVRVGAGLTGYDVLGYHAYAATATWLVSSPSGAITPSAATPDWQVTYLYNRWRPTLYVTASTDTSFFAGSATDTGTPTSLTRREHQLEGGLIYQILHTRAQHLARVAIVRSVSDYTSNTSTFSRDRTPIRLSWATLTGRTYGYSISPEDGVAVGATTEIVRHGLGSFADATTTTGDARAYLPGLALHHVVALRIGGGASIGDPTVGRTFLLGGDSPGNNVIDLSSDAFSLLRGFEPDTFAGTHVAIANAEYRMPFARPQRGHGTWPLFLHTVHAAVFADAGYIWTSAFDRHDIKSSAGAQLSADLVAGFYAPFTVSVGAAWGHDGSGRVGDRVTAYFRVGKGF